MTIDSTTVRRIAQLARIAINEEELDLLSRDLGRVLDLAGELAIANLAGVEPMAHPHEQTLVLRADSVTEGDQSQALLALAPQSQSGLYLVPKVIE